MIDLFAGCGGMTVGFAGEGFEPVLAVEWDRFAAATYAANWGEDHMVAGDIAEVKESHIPRSDVVIGGPPCQGFSNLGLKALDDPRNQLWREYMRFIRRRGRRSSLSRTSIASPSHPSSRCWSDEVEHGILKDYDISYGVLNAADYGVAQRRRRTIVIGSRVGRIDLPEPTHARDRSDGAPALANGS